MQYVIHIRKMSIQNVLDNYFSGTLSSDISFFLCTSLYKCVSFLENEIKTSVFKEKK